MCETKIVENSKKFSQCNIVKFFSPSETIFYEKETKYKVYFSEKPYFCTKKKQNIKFISRKNRTFALGKVFFIIMVSKFS